MPHGDITACVLMGLASILMLIIAGLAYSMRPAKGQQSPARKTAWNSLLMSTTFGLKSAQEYHPYPKNWHNPYAAAFSGLLVIALVRALQELRERRRAKQAGSLAGAPSSTT